MNKLSELYPYRGTQGPVGDEGPLGPQGVKGIQGPQTVPPKLYDENGDLWKLTINSDGIISPVKV